MANVTPAEPDKRRPEPPGKSESADDEQSRSAARRLGKCPVCSYSLRGLSNEYSCPECGFPYDSQTRIWRPLKPKAIFGGLIVFETVAYWVLTTDMPFGRLSVLSGSYGLSGKLQPVGFWELFDRFGMEHGFRGAIRILFVFYLGSILLLLIFARRNQKGLWAVVVISATFYF